MKRLLAIVTLLASCSRQSNQTPVLPEIPGRQWLENAISVLSDGHVGWGFIEEGGSAISGISETTGRIVLDGVTYDQAMMDFKSLTLERVKSLGYMTSGVVESRVGNILTGFSISVKTLDTTGTIVVSSAPIDRKSVLLVVAISQQLK